MLGAIVHTAIDGAKTTFSYEIDGDNCLVCTTETVNVNPAKDAKTADVKVGGQVNATKALKQLDYLKALKAGAVEGDIDGLKAKITAANPARPAAEIAAEQAALAQAQASAVEDY